MGTAQSADEGKKSDTGASQPVNKSMKTDYYDLLGLAKTASEDDVKRAYKKKALELHPDRNFNDVDRATKLFTEVQAAYEVLSDPHERAWYDSHKQQILDDEDAETPGQQVGVTTAADLLRHFSRFSSRMDFSDNAKGFYSIASDIFQTLAEEEEAASNYAGEDIVYYPSFGNSRSGYEDFVKPFYNSWASFRTQKTFSWMDLYRYQDAPDRRIKRLMEKENKKIRENAIKEFNSTVQEFIIFIRKRDPRFMPNFQTDAERNEAAQAAAKQQSMRDRAANAAKLAAFEEPEWMRANAMEDDQEDEEEEEEIREEYECVVCDKIFKSEKSLDAHEQTKKHLKNVQQLRRRMAAEDKNLELEALGKDEKVYDDTEDLSDIEDITNEFHSSADEAINKIGKSSEDSRDNSTVEAERGVSSQAMPEPADSGLVSTNETVEDAISLDVSVEDLSISGTLTPKMGKARAKRAKRAQRDSEEPGQRESCAVCNENFTSRTKLFQHIKDEGHAIVPPALDGKAKGKKKKNR